MSSPNKKALNRPPDKKWIEGNSWIEYAETRETQLTRLGKIFHITEELEDIIDAVLTKGREISHLDRLYFESSDFDSVGNAILERHENYSPDGIPERLRVDNILLRHPKLCSADAFQYKNLMLKADFTVAKVISHVDLMIRKQGYSETMSWLEQIAEAMDSCRPKDRIESVDETDEDLNGMPPLYGFHKIDTVFEQPEAQDYFEKQSQPVMRLFTTPERCKTLEQLTKLGKKCYEAEKIEQKTDYQQVYLSLSNSQREVFWTRYNSRKKEFLPSQPYTDSAKGLYVQVQKADERDMKGLSRKLWRIQHREIKVQNPPKEDEWNLLWNAYKQKEYQHNNPLPEIPEGYSRCGYCYKTKGKMYRPKMELQLGKIGPPHRANDTTLHCLSCDKN